MNKRQYIKRFTDKTNKLKECGTCQEIKPFSEMLKNDYDSSVKARCKACHKEYARKRSFKVRQENLKLKFQAKDQNIILCNCGDYFISRSANFNRCMKCRRSN